MRRYVSLLVLVHLMACSHAGAPATIPTGSGSPTPAPSVLRSTEKPIPAESNPPGDIPDNQAYVLTHAAGGFDIKVPEGWARTSTTSGEAFTDKLNSITIKWRASSQPPTVTRARNHDDPDLARTQRAFELRGITTAMLPAGTAILITYRANSAPNDVTGKQYRIEVLLYELWRGGREADVSLSSPVGADNVDPWQIVMQSVTWR